MPRPLHANDKTDYWLMSNAAYNEAGSSHPFSGDLEAPSYEKMVRHLSGSDSTVYHNLDHPDEYTIAYRGSRFERHLASDTGADLAIATGLEGYNPRFRKALATYDALRLEHPKASIHLTGHSLGGGEAMYVSRQRGAKATAFDPGMGIDAFVRTLRGVRNGNIDIERVPLDPVSALSELPSEGTMHWYRPRTYNPHNLSDNFYPRRGRRRIRR